MRATVKQMAWCRDGAELTVARPGGETVVLVDELGEIEALLELLRDGSRSADELARALAVRWPSVTVEDVGDALAGLDELGLLVGSDGAEVLSGVQRERYFSNLAFFAANGSLAEGPQACQRRLGEAHVVLLGVGGVGSTTLMCLGGLGVGRLTLVDCDRVELKNFARQFVYRLSDLGKAKIERAAAWVTAFNDHVRVEQRSCEIDSAAAVAELVAGADLVISGVDRPAGEIDAWVNEGCVGAGVPYIRGGVFERTVKYWSVDPGRSACVACARHEQDRVQTELARKALALTGALEPVNVATGPVACLVGSLVATEAMRYLTGFAPPAAAGAERIIDISDMTEEVHAWPRWRDCPVCATAPACMAGGHRAEELVR
jgi:molybdopterin-synthase adenylyltransferase